MKNRIKFYREKRSPKILQEELAEAINMKPAQISQMERGHFIPSLKLALHLSNAFSQLLGEEVYVDDLFLLERSDLRKK